MSGKTTIDATLNPCSAGSLDSVVRGIIVEWEAEADLLKSGNHPRRQPVPRTQVLQEECALRGCIADIKRVLLDASNAEPTPEQPTTTERTTQPPLCSTDLLGKYPLRIEVRPLLTFAVCGSSPSSIFIMLAEHQTRKEAEVSLWHEIVHVLLRAGGGTIPETSAELTTLENTVEAIARKLAFACPEIVELCGVQAHFPNESSSPTAADGNDGAERKP